MGAITLDGKTCGSAHVTCPRRGAWTADVELHSADPLAGTLVLQIGKRKMRGTVVRSAAYGGTTKARLIGGYAGWRKSLPPKSYSHAEGGGVKKSSVLGDAARECGEKLGPFPDRVVGALWIRDGFATAEHALELLAGGEWYIDDDGLTQVTARPTSRITSAFIVTSRSADGGRIEVATEAFEDWLPGRSFVSPTTPDEQTVSLVTLDARDGASPRVSVLTGPSTEERMLDSFRSIVRQELVDVFYAGMWSYTILEATDKTVTAKPNSLRVPPIVNCPMLPGLIGEKVTPKPGATCYVVFADLDPGKPFVAHIEGTPLKSVIEAETLLQVKGAILQLNDGAQPLARLGDNVAGVLAITSGNPTILG